jgi:uncharacterized membrane protein
MNMRKKWKLIVIAPAAIVGVLVLVTIFVAIGGEIVKQLWNWLLPPLFGWHQVTFWQAVGILVLCRILFGGHVYRSNSRRRSPEERERFRKAMRERFGLGRSNCESKSTEV